jgi:hypothetical protein
MTLNNALLAVMHSDGFPDPAREPGRFGFFSLLSKIT